MNKSELYTPPQAIQNILEGHGTSNRIMAEGETPQDLLTRVTDTLIGVEHKFGTSPDEIEEIKSTFKKYFIARDFTPGVPTLTNAGRAGYESSPLSSCVVIPVDLRKETASEIILSHYQKNMGSGFNLTKYEDPVAMLNWINNLSAQETATHKYDRRIANMGTLNVAHPKIIEFIETKLNNNLVHFNISVEINDQFMNAVMNGDKFELADGNAINARDLLMKISEAAWQCGDPGIINLERMNAQNPVAKISEYDCTPPCGEMGLAPGETCQFGYINLAHYINRDGSMNEKELTELVKFSVRVLDDAIEFGIDNQPSEEGQQIARLKRKMGISVVGLADALMKAGIPYDSAEGREKARDVFALINYQAKLASVELAKERGSCEAMKYIHENKYFDGYIKKRYANQNTTTVAAEKWEDLDQLIKTTGMLRNIHHTALPPGGRASMILGVNHSIEPIFGPSNLNIETIEQILDLIAGSLVDEKGELDVQDIFNKAIEEGTFQHLPITAGTKRLLKTAIEIDPEDHVLMAAVLSGMDGVCDESVSKTVNLPITATPNDILNIYLLAHKAGLKNISVYRDKSLENQPRTLS